MNKHYSDPLIKAYLERVGRVFGDLDRRCRKCGLPEDGVSVRWQDEMMQMQCTRCRFEWTERPQDSVPEPEQQWRWLLQTAASAYTRLPLIEQLLDPSDSVRSRKALRDAEERLAAAELRFKDWIAATMPESASQLISSTSFDDTENQS